MRLNGTVHMRIEERITRTLALLAGYALLLQAVITAIEIIARKVFNHSFQGVDELGGYALAITGGLGFGYAAVKLAHTRVDFLLLRLTLPLRATLHQFASLVLLIVSGGMLWYSVRSLRQSIELGAISTTPLQTPLWIPQSLWVAGMVMFTLVALIIEIRCLTKLFRRDFEGVEREMKAQSQNQMELESLGLESSPGGTK